jgi:two-component system cell cycle response regulator CtrA
MYDDVKLRENGYKERIAFLEQENEKLKRIITSLRPAGDDFALVRKFDLTRSEEALLSPLMTRALCSKEHLFDSLYLCFEDRASEPSIKIVDVFICKLRDKLEKYGVTIETRWGWGYYLTKETKAQIIALIKPEVPYVIPESTTSSNS